MDPIIAVGQTKTLDELDMPDLATVDTAPNITDTFQRHWDQELHLPQPRLWRALLRTFLPLQRPLYPYMFITSTVKILQATVGISYLINNLGEHGNPRYAYGYASVRLIHDLGGIDRMIIIVGVGDRWLWIYSPHHASSNADDWLADWPGDANVSYCQHFSQGAAAPLEVLAWPIKHFA